MSRTQMLLFVLPLSFIALGLAASGQEPTADATGEFKDKIVVISCKSDASTGACLKDVVQRTLGRQTFLVGLAVDSGHPEDWTKGRRVWIAVDDIAMIVEFPSLEEYHNQVNSRI